MGHIEEYNSRHLNRLAEILRAGHGVGLIGAGVSIACGYPGWRAFLESLEKKLQPKLSKNYLRELRAKDIRTRLDETVGMLGNHYADIFHETFSPAKDRKFPPWLRLLFNLNLQLILTTNYTTELEEAARLDTSTPLNGAPQPVRWFDSPKLYNVLRGISGAQSIVYLHGRWDDSPTLQTVGKRSWSEVILGETSYKFAYEHPGEVKNFLITIGRTNTLLIIGSSLDDDDVTGAFRAVQAIGGRQINPHYAVLPLRGDERPETVGEEKYDRFGIRPLFYSVRTGKGGREDHSEIQYLLSSIAMKVDPRAEPDRPVRVGFDPDIERYRECALERFSRTDMIGVIGGGVSLDLSEVYVPLRFSLRSKYANPYGKRPARPIYDYEEDHLELESILSDPRIKGRHLLILGDPGSGKSTGLQKLLCKCLWEGGDSLGLNPRTVPVFLRLRRLKPDDSFVTFLQKEIERELGKDSKHGIPADLGKRLWRDCHLLLLLDGLDEITDDDRRGRFLRDLEGLLRHRDQRDRIRAVISCRHFGYVGGLESNKTFATLEVQPFKDDQIAKFVTGWFREAYRADPIHSEEVATKKAKSLIEGLRPHHAHQSHNLKVLVSSPLLLTLLCVVAHRGDEIPRHRVTFYEQCLNVLLSKRRESGGAERPLLDIGTILAILRPLAYELHASERSSDLTRWEFAYFSDGPLKSLGEKSPTPNHFAVLDWLHKQAGILNEFAQQRYGFFHRGIQEYLCALHIASHGETMLDEVVARVDDPRWHEVILLLVALPNTRLFGPFMKRLLRTSILSTNPSFIRDCLNECPEVDYSPFIERINLSTKVDEQIAILQLLMGRSHPDIICCAKRLSRAQDSHVRDLADRILSSAKADAPGNEVLVFYPALPPARVNRLSKQIRAQGIRITPKNNKWRSSKDTDFLETICGALVFQAGNDPPVWDDQDVLGLLKMLRLRKCPVIPILLQESEAPPELPKELSGLEWKDLRNIDQINQELSGSGEQATNAPEPSPGSIIAGRRFTEKITGMVMLWVPEGRFQIGQGRRQEAPWVRISPFWIGETPVTNRQYGVFLRQTNHPEPEYWRSSRFSDPEQSVVGVSWHDAMAFCEWLSGVTNIKWLLCSEAQWEYAARGTDGRTYPWGNEEPTPKHACYDLDQDKGRPLPAGSYPHGHGPFDTLDQAGNVWEWCLDVWKENSYKRWLDSEPVDPVMTEGAEAEGVERVLRGACWTDPANLLPAAVRYRRRDTYRAHRVGFRVAVNLASL